MYQLDEVLALAKEAGVGFTCVYCECDSSWYFCINSTASSEQWMGKNRSFKAALEDVIDCLTGIINALA